MRLVIHEDEVDAMDLPGRAHKMVISPATGSKKMCAGVATFPAGRHAPAHVHDQAEEILYVLSGSGRMYFDGRPETIRTGSFMLVQPGVEHSLEADQEADLEVFYVFSPPVEQGSYDKPEQ